MSTQATAKTRYRLPRKSKKRNTRIYKNLVIKWRETELKKIANEYNNYWRFVCCGNKSEMLKDLEIYEAYCTESKIHPGKALKRYLTEEGKSKINHRTQGKKKKNTPKTTKKARKTAII